MGYSKRTILASPHKAERVKREIATPWCAGAYVKIAYHVGRMGLYVARFRGIGNALIGRESKS